MGTHSLTATYAATDSIHAGSSTASAFALTVRPRTTTTGVSCAPSSIPVNDSSTCTETGRASCRGREKISGVAVSLKKKGTGTFTACTLSASNPATCTSTLTPSVIGAGRHSLTATYAATDSIHAGSNTSTAFALTVRTRTTTTGVSCAPSSIPVNDSSTCT